MKQHRKKIGSIFIFMLLIFCPFRAEAQFEHSYYVTVDLPTEADLLFMQNIGAELKPAHPDLPIEARSYVVTEAQITTMEDNGLEFRVIYQLLPKTKGTIGVDKNKITRAKIECDDRYDWYSVNSNFDSASASSSVWFEMYRDIDEIEQRIASWDQTHSFVSVEELDLEYEPLVTELDGTGTPISVQKVYDNNIHIIHISKGNVPKPTILISGNEHANEWIGSMTAMYVADRVISALDNPTTPEDDELSLLLDHVDLVVVPLLNPKGFRFTWAHECPDPSVNVTDSSGDITPEYQGYIGYRMWRKNISGYLEAPDPGSTCESIPFGDEYKWSWNPSLNCFGVDLNRNWDWLYKIGSTSSSISYSGLRAFSEKETDKLKEFIIANPQIVRHVDLHSFMQEIVWQDLQSSTGSYAGDDLARAALYNVVGTQFKTLIEQQNGRGKGVRKGQGGQVMTVDTYFFSTKCQLSSPVNHLEGSILEVYG